MDENFQSERKMTALPINYASERESLFETSALRRRARSERKSPPSH